MKQQSKRILALCLLAALALGLAAPAAAADAPIRIGFIDSGISTKHIDPAQVAEGKNYVFPEKDTADRIGHGTATAGMVLGAAEQNVYGVCPDAVAVPLVVVDAYPSGVVENGGAAALCAAIYDAVDRFGCRIINVSLGTGEDSPALRAAVAYAEERGVTIVAAVGNGGADGAPSLPAAYATVVAVGAYSGGGAAAFSQRGADVLSDGAGLAAATNRNSPLAATVSGTSYACAIVSGVCAKILAAYPSLRPAQLREGLCALAEDLLPPGFDDASGWGVVHADCAVSYPYLDVPADAQYASAVRYVTERGLMNGLGGGLFRPQSPMTRAMFAAVLYRRAGAPETGAALRFSDVAPGAWYADAVRWAAAEGIIRGCGDGRFGAEDPLTREQMATMLWRAAGCPAAPGAARDALAGAGAVSAWAVDAFAWAVDAGLVGAAPGAALAPGEPALRGEIAQLMLRCAAEAPAPPEHPAGITEE